MKNFYKMLFACTTICTFVSFSAHAGVEPSFDPDKPRAATPWYGRITPAERAADIDFISGMRPHHAGALTMSQQYLDDPNAKNGMLKQLARGIIHNQKFEISMLDTIAALHKKADSSQTLSQIAVTGLAQQEKFQKAPAPGFFDKISGSSEVSVRDVQFAKAMIVHHQGALVMADDYLMNENADNGYLRLMCLDILRDQNQEIDLMNSIIAAYPGNPDDVKITPSMVHGMGGMKHTSAPAASSDGGMKMDHSHHPSH